MIEQAHNSTTLTWEDVEAVLHLVKAVHEEHMEREYQKIAGIIDEMSQAAEEREVILGVADHWKTTRL